MHQLPLNIRLDSNATLKNFYVGANDTLLVKLNEIVIGKDDLVFISGSENSGKSHIAQAVCNQLSDTQQRSCVYLPLSNTEITPEILIGLSEIDLVCLDDLEKIEHDRKWQIGIFNLFNEIKEAGKSLIVCSRLSPRQIDLSLKDLQSRLASMTVYKIKNIPDNKLLDFIIEQGELLGMQLNPDVANFILNRSDRSVDNLKIILNTLDEQSLAHQRRITVPFVKTVLQI